jgi:hypothetical protein
MSYEELIILIHESALDNMQQQERRLIQRMRDMREEIETLSNDIRTKKMEITVARDNFLRRCI